MDGLYDGCSKDDPTTIESILSATETAETLLLQPVDDKGTTLLMVAATLGHDRCVEVLLRRLPEAQVVATTTEGVTALMDATSNGHERCVDLLLRHVPERQVLSASHDGWTALFGATTYGHARCAERLLRHAPAKQIAARRDVGTTPLMAAAAFTHPSCVDALLQHEPTVQLAACDERGANALVYASWNCRVFDEESAPQRVRDDAKGCVVRLLAKGAKPPPGLHELYDWIWPIVQDAAAITLVPSYANDAIVRLLCAV